MSGKTKALSLYRNILRAHREKLPFHLRQLGDAYVREEFKRHKKADPKWLVSFFQEWNGYLTTVQEQTNASEGRIGEDMPREAMSKLTEEQKLQLSKLKEEAAAMYKR